jgi:hypothetical protein
MKKITALFLAAVLIPVLGLAAPGQNYETTVAAQNLSTKPAPELRTEIVRLKYVNYSSILSILRVYSSPNGKISSQMSFDNSSQSGAIVIKDTPEIVDKILSVIKELDVKPVELQFTVQIIQGSEGDEKGDEALKNDPVIRELRNVLRYKSFSLLDGTMLRVIDGGRAESKVGPNGEFSLHLIPTFLKDGTNESIQVQIQFSETRMRTVFLPLATDKKPDSQVMQPTDVELIKTTLLLKSGEKTVVGVSKSAGDKGLILIISGKPIK